MFKLYKNVVGFCEKRENRMSKIEGRKGKKSFAIKGKRERWEKEKKRGKRMFLLLTLMGACDIIIIAKYLKKRACCDRRIWWNQPQWEQEAITPTAWASLFVLG